MEAKNHLTQTDFKPLNALWQVEYPFIPWLFAKSMVQKFALVKSFALKIESYEPRVYFCHDKE